MLEQDILPIPRYIKNVDSIFEKTWTELVKELPFSQTHNSSENNSVTFSADVLPNLEENIGKIVRLEVTVSWWDYCKNGHNSFIIRSHAYTKTSRNVTDLRKDYYQLSQQDVDMYFPHLKPAYSYYKALFSPYGPLYYLENTTYLAGNKDFRGFEPGQQTTNKEGALAWRSDVAFGIHYGEKTPIYNIPIISEGKARQFEVARQAAFWPDADDAVLSGSREVLLQKLAQRLPLVMQEFKAYVHSLGFTY